jgi:glycogen debranching enzyme
VYRDQTAAKGFFDSMSAAIRFYGVGSLAEIYDGDAPFAPRGCIAQAWSVGEVLRAWTELARAPKPVNKEEGAMNKKTASPV